MPLQSFVDNTLPTIKAAWLNAVDAFYFTLFNSATTAAQARTALGSTTVGDAVFIAATAETARTALGVVVATPITNSLSADVVLNNTANYFDGPSVAQGATGTWFSSGTVSVQDTNGNAEYHAKLWDGTTVIAAATFTSIGVNVRMSASLSGYITSPAGNIRISVKDVSSTGGLITFNTTGTSKDSTITASRIA